MNKETTITTTVHNEGSGEFESREFNFVEFIDFHTVGLNAIEKMCQDQDDLLPPHLSPFTNEFETARDSVNKLLASLFDTLLIATNIEAEKEAKAEAEAKAETEAKAEEETKTVEEAKTKAETEAGTEAE